MTGEWWSLNLLYYINSVLSHDGRRKHRRIATEFLGPKATAKYSVEFSKEANSLIKSLLVASKDGTVSLDLQVRVYPSRRVIFAR